MALPQLFPQVGDTRSLGFVRHLFTPEQVEGLRPEIAPPKNRPHGGSTAFCPPPQKQVSPFGLKHSG